MAKIIVVIEDGFVQEVLSSDPVEVAVIDYDTAGADTEDIRHIPQGDGAFVDASVGFRPVDVSPARIEELLAAIA
jgi:hypothetical protein